MNSDIENNFAEIMSLRQQMQAAVGSTKDQINELETQMREIMDPYVLKIQDLTDKIETSVFENQKSFKCDYGKATYRKEYIRNSWDNKRLEGYAEAGHDEIYQFRKETIVKAGVTVKVGE